MQQAWNTTGKERSQYVQRMFGQIASNYDLMNSVMSFRLHYRWRAYAVKLAILQPGDSAIDVCCGTGDFCFDLAKAVGAEGEVVGVDFCAPMLQLAHRKANARHQNNIRLAMGDALNLPLPDERFQCATVGWGIRNVADIVGAFQEMTRVVKPGGKVICLDMAKPRFKPFAALYNFGFYYMLPFIGRLIRKKDAYTYLPNSVTNFPEREELAEKMRQAGLINIRVIDLAFGAVCIHLGEKPCPAQPT